MRQLLLACGLGLVVYYALTRYFRRRLRIPVTGGRGAVKIPVRGVDPFRGVQDDIDAWEKEVNKNLRQSR